MKFGLIAKHPFRLPAAWLCEALSVSRSGFHAWLKRGPCARSREDEAIMPAVRASFVASARTYCAHRIWRDVLEAGFSCGLHKIERLMRAQALRARPRRRARQRTMANVQPQQSRRMCSTASSGRTSPTANGLPTSPMSGRSRALSGGHSTQTGRTPQRRAVRRTPACLPGLTAAHAQDAWRRPREGRGLSLDLIRGSWPWSSEAAHHRGVGFDPSLGRKAIAKILKRDVGLFGPRGLQKITVRRQLGRPMAAVPDRLSRAFPFNPCKPLDRHGFADCVTPRRRAPAHLAPLHRVNHPITQVLRIRLRHSLLASAQPTG